MAQDLLQKLEHDIIKRRDLNLVRQTLDGHKAGFAKLMSYYKVRVFNFGKKFFHNEADSEDFVQDVFLKVYTKLDTFQGKSMFSTWLMRIAYTTAINSVNRKKETTSLIDEEFIVDKSSTPEENQIRKVTQEAIQQALQELPEKYAVCVEMYFYYDIPYQEISEITEFPVNTIKSHIFRAKKLLKEKLEDLYEQR